MFSEIDKKFDEILLSFSENPTSISLVSKAYTMGPTFATGITRGVSKIVGNWIGDWFN